MPAPLYGFAPPAQQYQQPQQQYAPARPQYGVPPQQQQQQQYTHPYQQQAGEFISQQVSMRFQIEPCMQRVKMRHALSRMASPQQHYDTCEGCKICTLSP